VAELLVHVEGAKHVPMDLVHVSTARTKGTRVGEERLRVALMLMFRIQMPVEGARKPLPQAPEPKIPIFVGVRPRCETDRLAIGPTERKVATPELPEHERRVPFERGALRLILLSIDAGEQRDTSSRLGWHTRHVADHDKTARALVVARMPRHQAGPRHHIIVEQQNDLTCRVLEPNSDRAPRAPVWRSEKADPVISFCKAADNITRPVITAVRDNDQFRRGRIRQQRSQRLFQAVRAPVRRHDDRNSGEEFRLLGCATHRTHMIDPVTWTARTVVPLARGHLVPALS